MKLTPVGKFAVAGTIILVTAVSAWILLCDRPSVFCSRLCIVWQEGEPTPERDWEVERRKQGDVIWARYWRESASAEYTLSNFMFSGAKVGPQYRVVLSKAIPDAKVVFRYARERVFVEVVNAPRLEYSGGAKLELRLAGAKRTLVKRAILHSTGGSGLNSREWRLAEVNVGELEAGQWDVSLACTAPQEPGLPPLHMIVLDGFWIMPSDVPISPEESSGLDRIRSADWGWFGVALPRGEVDQNSSVFLRAVARRFDGKPPKLSAMLEPSSGRRVVLRGHTGTVAKTSNACEVNFPIPALPDGKYTLRMSAEGMEGDFEVPLNLFGEFFSELSGPLAKLTEYAEAPDKDGRAEAKGCHSDFKHALEYINDCRREIPTSRDPLRIVERIRRVLKQSEVTMLLLDRGADPYARRPGALQRAVLASDGQRLLPYRVFVPESYQAAAKMPVVVMLHGGGETEDLFPDLEGGLALKMLGERGYLMVSPRTTGWPDEKDRQDLLDIIATVGDEYPKTDPKRVYLVGHSKGGWGAYETAAERPDLFAAIVCISGVTDPELADRLKGVPIMLIHGQKDTTVSPARSVAVAERLKELGYACELHLFRDHDHRVVGHLEQYLTLALDFFDRNRKDAKPEP